MRKLEQNIRNSVGCYMNIKKEFDIPLELYLELSYMERMCRLSAVTFQYPE